MTFRNAHFTSRTSVHAVFPLWVSVSSQPSLLCCLCSVPLCGSSPLVRQLVPSDFDPPYSRMILTSGKMGFSRKVTFAGTRGAGLQHLLVDTTDSSTASYSQSTLQMSSALTSTFFFFFSQKGDFRMIDGPQAFLPQALFPLWTPSHCSCRIQAA